MPRRESPTGRRRLKAAERRQKACRLRTEGWDYEYIGRQLGITKQAAHYLVKTALADLRAKTEEAAADIRSIELKRLDLLTTKLFARALKKNDDAAIDRLLRVMQRRADLTGIDAPKRQENSGPGGGPIPVAGMLVSADNLKNLTEEELDGFEKIVAKLGTRRSADSAADTGGESSTGR